MLLAYVEEKDAAERWILYFLFNERISGSRDGAVVRALVSNQCGPGSIPGLGAICGLSLLLVRVLASRRFPPDAPIFPSLENPNCALR